MDGQDVDAVSTGRPEETETPPAPNVAEDQDLCAVLLAGRREETFELPGAAEPPFFVRLRSMSGVELDGYYSEGQRFTMDVPRGPGQGPRPRERERMDWTMDRTRQFRTLVERSVVDYRLALNREIVKCKTPGKFSPGDWTVFTELPMPVKRWVEETIREFQGIRLLEEGDEQGEA